MLLHLLLQPHSSDTSRLHIMPPLFPREVDCALVASLASRHPLLGASLGLTASLVAAVQAAQQRELAQRQQLQQQHPPLGGSDGGGQAPWSAGMPSPSYAQAGGPMPTFTQQPVGGGGTGMGMGMGLQHGGRGQLPLPQHVNSSYYTAAHHSVLQQQQQQLQGQPMDNAGFYSSSGSYLSSSSGSTRDSALMPPPQQQAPAWMTAGGGGALGSGGGYSGGSGGTAPMPSLGDMSHDLLGPLGSGPMPLDFTMTQVLLLGSVNLLRGTSCAAAGLCHGRSRARWLLQASSSCQSEQLLVQTSKTLRAFVLGA